MRGGGGKFLLVEGQTIILLRASICSPFLQFQWFSGSCLPVVLVEGKIYVLLNTDGSKANPALPSTYFDLLLPPLDELLG